MAFPMSAARGVTKVVDRCEAAKTSGYLDLSSCSLMYIADAVYLKLQECEITKVSVRDNALKKFPKKFVTKFPGAVLFNIEGNKLSEFPEELGEWTEMRGINAANNELTTWPEGVFKMQKLGILDLSGNRIEKFDVELLFSSCTSLVQLNLSGNPLDEEIVSRLNQQKPEKLVLKL